jgi:outer membrane murein-binding lipoprotein Lpp
MAAVGYLAANPVVDNLGAWTTLAGSVVLSVVTYLIAPLVQRYVGRDKFGADVRKIEAETATVVLTTVIDQLQEEVARARERAEAAERRSDQASERAEEFRDKLHALQDERDSTRQLKRLDPSAE